MLPEEKDKGFGAFSKAALRNRKETKKPSSVAKELLVVGKRSAMIQARSWKSFKTTVRFSFLHHSFSLPNPMDIIWHGYTCFTIKTKEGAAVINPYSSNIGLKLPPLKAGVTLLSGEESDYDLKAVTTETKILNWPGEYEVGGIAITAQLLSSETEKGVHNMLYMLDAEGLKICYLSNLSGSFTEEIIENIGEVDVLILPVGADKDAPKKAHQLIEQIEPRAVVPMLFKTDGLIGDTQGIEDFAKQAGLTTIETRDKFTLGNKNDLPEDKTEFVILKPVLG